MSLNGEEINPGEAIVVSRFGPSSDAGDYIDFDNVTEIVWDTSKITGDNVRVMNIDRAKSLGFKQTISLEEGVRRTINWYRDER